MKKIYVLWETNRPGRLSYITPFNSGEVIQGVCRHGFNTWIFATKKEAEEFKDMYESNPDYMADHKKEVIKLIRQEQIKEFGHSWIDENGKYVRQATA